MQDGVAAEGDVDALGPQHRRAPGRARPARAVRGNVMCTRVAAGVAHGHRHRVPAEVVAEARDGRRARVGGEGERRRLRRVA